jgi:hypothetical protein
MKYVIGKDEDGRWCIYGMQESGQKTATIYAKDLDALTQIFLMLEGSTPLFCKDADDVDATDVRIA